MPIGKADLQLYWQKLLIGLLSMLTSRKFWVMALADLTAYGQYLDGALTGRDLVAVVVAGAVAYIAGVAYEDGQAKRGSA